MKSIARVPGLAPGLTGSHQVVVSAEITSVAAGTGELDVLSTPHLLALLEIAALDALGDILGPHLTTIGVRVELEHLLPAAVGEVVTATISLLSIRGRRLTFAGKVHDSQERTVGVVRLVRAVTERDEYP